MYFSKLASKKYGDVYSIKNGYYLTAFQKYYLNDPTEK